MVDFGSIPSGSSKNFVVLALLSDGTTTSLTNAGLTATLTNDSDPSFGSAVVNPDGTSGVVSAGAANGQGNFHVTAGAFTDTAQWTTVPAVTVVGIAITPVSGVVIKAK